MLTCTGVGDGTAAKAQGKPHREASSQQHEHDSFITATITSARPTITQMKKEPTLGKQWHDQPITSSCEMASCRARSCSTVKMVLGLLHLWLELVVQKLMIWLYFLPHFLAGWSKEKELIIEHFTCLCNIFESGLLMFYWFHLNMQELLFLWLK